MAFTEAKATLSDIVTAVVRDHQPHLVRRHGGKETVILVRPDDLADFLAPFAFNSSVIEDRNAHGDTEVTIELSALGLLGFGSTLDSALTDLLDEVRAYATRFFERYAFYRETDRAAHAPWLLRFAATEFDRQMDLLRAGIGQTRQPGDLPVSAG